MFRKNLWQPPPTRSSDVNRSVSFGFQQIPETEKAGRIIRHFNTVADKYDFMNTLLSLGIHYWWKRTAVGMLHLAPGDKVIDVCGGTGDLAILASRAVGESGKVVIYDINENMMRVGRKNLNRSAEGRRIGWIGGDAESISFPANTFDAAMVGFGIRNLTHMEQGFGEMRRVLKPGGKIMCLEFSKPTAPFFRRLYDLYSFYVMPFLGELLAGSRQAYTLLPESIRTFPPPHDLAALLRKIGFRRVVYRRLTNGIAVVYLAEKDSRGGEVPG